MFKTLSGLLLLTSLLAAVVSEAAPRNTTAVCGSEIDPATCDFQKLDEFNALVKKTDPANVAAYTAKQKAFFEVIADNCGDIPETCQALIKWQRSAEPEPPREPASTKEKSFPWIYLVHLMVLFALYKAVTKGSRLLFRGLSAAWEGMDSELGREARKEARKMRMAESRSPSSGDDGDYFADAKRDFDFGLSGTGGGGESSHDTHSSGGTSLWRVEGYYTDQKSYTLHLQINAESADEAREKVRRDKRNFVISRVSPY